MGENNSAPLIHVVMVEPEIPPNTGNVARLCAAVGCKLHLVRPLGFKIDDKHVRRAGLDYWDLLDLEVHDSLSAILEATAGTRRFFSSTKGRRFYSDVNYRAGDYLFFGPETRGLPKDLLDSDPEHTIRIPMIPNKRARSLNLSNSVAIVVYEVLRQLQFPGLT